jgi:hypothetical protein
MMNKAQSKATKAEQERRERRGHNILKAPLKIHGTKQAPLHTCESSLSKTIKREINKVSKQPDGSHGFY